MTAPVDISAKALAELLELAARSIHSLGYAESLYPAQWTALRYFARAEDGRRTASDLARFQGLATGPVSRTVRTLIAKRLVAKASEQPSGRAEHLELTGSGHDLLTRDPMSGVTSAMDRLSTSEREALASALRQVIRVASTMWPGQKPRG